MPSNILNADVGFPEFSEEQNDKEKIDQIVNYLYMLLEQLRYSLYNLDADNFNDKGLEELQLLITEPIYAHLEDDEGKIADLAVTAAGLSSRMTSVEGGVSTLTQTANALTGRISDAEGNITSLQATASGLYADIHDQETGAFALISANANAITQKVSAGDVSAAISAFAGGLNLSVTNNGESTYIRLTSGGVDIGSRRTISFSGLVAFSDLSTSGYTTINGDNITTGTIEAIDITGCTFNTILSSGGTVGGEINMYYYNQNYLAGGIRLDDDGSGSEDEAKYRMFLYTKRVSNIDFALKLEAAGGCSIEAGQNIWIEAATTMVLKAPSIDLRGTVKINGTPI